MGECLIRRISKTSATVTGFPQCFSTVYTEIEPASSRIQNVNVIEQQEPPGVVEAIVYYTDDNKCGNITDGKFSVVKPFKYTKEDPRGWDHCVIPQEQQKQGWSIVLVLKGSFTPTKFYFNNSCGDYLGAAKGATLFGGTSYDTTDYTELGFVELTSRGSTGELSIDTTEKFKWFMIYIWEDCFKSTESGYSGYDGSAIHSIEFDGTYYPN